MYWTRMEDHYLLICPDLRHETRRDTSDREERRGEKRRGEKRKRENSNQVSDECVQNR